jgi:UDP:flavonoid glycosyltransferase YjiC (YdhE family)
MRVGLQGWGSEGDLRPLIALAARLRRSGHEARVVLTPNRLERLVNGITPPPAR